MDQDAVYKTPGQLIESLLRREGWTQRVLAAVLDTSESTLNKIISGKQAVSAETALELGEVFGVEAECFLNLQKEYDLARARLVTRPNPARATRARLFGDLPIAEMIKRGWLRAASVRDVAQVETSLTTFFNAASARDIRELPYAAKRTNVTEHTLPVQVAWLYRVRQIAAEMIVGRFSVAGARRAVAQLRLLTCAAEEARKVPRILAEAGIRFVLVEALPRSKIDGVCCWLNDRAPVIALSCRYDRIDNFWFVLRHEMEHVIRGDGKTLVQIDTDLEGGRKEILDPRIADEERIANEAAAEFCVPQKALDSFILRKSPFFAERDILGMAATLKIHPGLIAGQLRHRTGSYNRFSKHLVKMRAIVAPGAMVDGWGDVAPLSM